MCKQFLTILSLVFVVGGVSRAEWSEPKDGKLTEKQVAAYVKVQKETIELFKSVDKEIHGARTNLGQVAIASGLADRYKAILAKNGLEENEWNWVKDQVEQAWAIVMLEDGDGPLGDPMRKLRESRDQAAAQLKEAKESLAAHEAALKSGKRVLTKEQRDEAIKQAESEKESAQGELKEANEAVKTAMEEVKKHLDEAAAAEAAAKNPPKEVEKDDLQSFIEGKKNEAREAREAAAEAQKSVAEAQGKVKEVQARIGLAEKRIASPDQPLSDEEKQQAREENEQAIAQGEGMVDAGEQTVKALDSALADWVKQHEEQVSKLPKGNLELVRRHAKEITDFYNNLGKDEK